MEIIMKIVHKVRKRKINFTTELSNKVFIVLLPVLFDVFTAVESNGLISHQHPSHPTSFSYSSTSHSLKDYCRWQFFNATCPQNHVILMTSALYGRMRFGRCTDMDQYTGCFLDSLWYFDLLCSGKRNCSQSVPIPQLHELQPCQKDLQTYLEAGFVCVSIQSGSQCSQSIQRFPNTPLSSQQMDHFNHKSLQQKLDPIPAKTIFFSANSSKQGFLSSHFTNQFSHLIRSCPCHLHASKGQKFELTLYDFNYKFNNEKSSIKDFYHDYQQPCLKIGSIEEPLENVHKEICSSTNRTSTLYVSSGHVVIISFSPTDGKDEDKNKVSKNINNKHGMKPNKDNDKEASNRYLIYYQVIGCVDFDFKPEVYEVVEKSDLTLTIACIYSNKQVVSRLRCHGHVWMGELKNCSEIDSAVTLSDYFMESDIYTHGLIVSIITGVMLGVIVGACLLFVVLAYRKKNNVNHQANKRFHSNSCNNNLDNNLDYNFTDELNNKQILLHYPADHHQSRKMLPPGDLMFSYSESYNDSSACSFLHCPQTGNQDNFKNTFKHKTPCEYVHSGILSNPNLVATSLMRPVDPTFDNEGITNNCKFTGNDNFCENSLNNISDGVNNNVCSSKICHSIYNASQSSPLKQGSIMPFDIIEN